MMSSVWTLRLKRRNAFSRGSPSCTRISAKAYTPPNPCQWADFRIAHYCGRKRAFLSNFAGLGRGPSRSEQPNLLKSRLFRAVRPSVAGTRQTDNARKGDLAQATPGILHVERSEMNQNIQTKSRSWWQVSLLECMAALRQRESQVFLVLSLVIGALTGLTVVAFILLTERLGMRLYPVSGAPWRRLLFPVAGSLGIGYLLYRFFPGARGSGIPQTKAALFATGGRGHWLGAGTPARIEYRASKESHPGGSGGGDCSRVQYASGSGGVRA